MEQQSGELERRFQTVYYAAGFGGNYIIINEENDLLVVTRWIDNSKIDDVMRLLQKAVE